MTKARLQAQRKKGKAVLVKPKPMGSRGHPLRKERLLAQRETCIAHSWITMHRRTNQNPCGFVSANREQRSAMQKINRHKNKPYATACK